MIPTGKTFPDNTVGRGTAKVVAAQEKEQKMTRIYTVTGHRVTTVAWNDSIEPGEYDGKISVDVLREGRGFCLRADDAQTLADELHERVTELRNNTQQYAQQ